MNLGPLVRDERPDAYMESAMKQPVDGRHRDKNGRVAKKHGNTLISSIRLTYPGFAPDEKGSSRLVDILDRLDEPSLTKLIKDTKDE